MKSNYIISILIIILATSALGCIDTVDPWALQEAYDKGYAEGLQGNTADYQNCSDFHSIYIDENTLECSFLLVGSTSSNTTMEFCRGYIHGYNTAKESAKKDAVYANVSAIAKG